MRIVHFYIKGNVVIWNWSLGTRL